MTDESGNSAVRPKSDVIGPCDETIEVDDMDDSKDMPKEHPLCDILQLFHDNLLQKYKDADEAALCIQEKYRSRALWAARLGSTAVILAIFQLSGLSSLLCDKLHARWPHLIPIPYVISWLEGVAALVMVGIVLFGIGTFLKEQWLLERYKAERMRLLKFGSLLERGLWSGIPSEVEKCKERLCDQADEIITTTFSALQGWMVEGTVPSVHEPPAASLSAANLEALVHYYRRKRLHYQMGYLSIAVERDQAKDRRTRLVGPSLFFGSVAFVLAHLAVAAAGGSDSWENGLIFIAAALPVAGAGCRIYRSANEFARNAARFEATHHTLSRLSARLRNVSEAPDIFRELGFCEQTFEFDLREWLRLMVEAEWFG